MTEAVRQVLRGGLQLSAARLVVMICMASQSFVLATVLGPIGFGQVSQFNLVLLYLGLISLGTDMVAAREIPGLQARQEFDRVERVGALAFTTEVSLRAVLSLLVAAAGLLFFDGLMRSGLLLVALASTFDRAVAVYQSLGSARREFGVLSRANMLSALITIFTTVAVVKFAGSLTQLVALLVTVVCTAGFLHLHLPLRLERVSLPEFRRMTSMGLPFVAMSLSFYVWRASDRTVIASMLDVRLLGLYAFAAACMQLVVVFMNDFHAAFQPLVYERTAQSRSARDLYRIIEMPSVVFAYATPIVIAAMWVAYPVLVAAFMPDYLESLWAFRALTFQLYFISVGSMAVYLLRSPELNRQGLLAWAYVVAAAVSYPLAIIAISRGFGITGAAVAVLAGQLVAIAVTFAVAHRHYLETASQARAYYAELIKPLIAMLIFAAGVWWLEGAAPSSSLRIVGEIGQFAILSAVLLLALNRRSGVLREVMRMRSGVRPLTGSADA